MEQVNQRSGRPRSFDTDDALLKSLLVFWEHGYEGASLSRLLAATGLTAPALYRAFGSKEDLFARAVRRYQEQFGFSIRSDLPLPAAIEEYLERAAREFTTDPGRGCMISTGLLATGPDAAGAAHLIRAEREHALDMIRARLAEALRSGELRADTDVDGLARTMAALVQGMSVQARDGADYDSLRAVVAVAGDCCSQALSAGSRTTLL